MKRLTLVGAAVLTALALTLPTPVLAGCRGGRCSVRRSDGPKLPLLRGVGRAIGKMLPPWRK